MSVTSLPLADRGALRILLDGRRPADALASYYALYHPPARTRLWVNRSEGGRADAFLVRAQTGQDLFRPLVTLRAPSSAAAVELLGTALPAGQAALFTVPESMANELLPLLSVETVRRLLLLKLNPARFEPVVNIFVLRAAAPDGLPRFEIRQGDQLVAAAGVNWQSPDWAEIFVHTDPAGRERGYGKSVCAALCARLLEERRSVLYAVEEDNLPSLRLAQSAGFEDTGERETLCAAAFQPS